MLTSSGCPLSRFPGVLTTLALTLAGFHASSISYFIFPGIAQSLSLAPGLLMQPPDIQVGSRFQHSAPSLRRRWPATVISVTSQPVTAQETSQISLHRGGGTPVRGCRERKLTVNKR